MYFKYYIFILLDVFILIEKSKSDFINKCSYEYTVDLTKSKQFQNKSYLYNNDILIPPNLVYEYKIRIFNNGTRIDNVKPHKRGCICAIKNCIRFCLKEVVELYRNRSSSDLDKRFTKYVTLSNKKLIEKHLLHDFHPIFGSVCESPELVPKNNWILFEDGILRHNLLERNLTQNEYCFDAKVFENNTLQFLSPVICNKSIEAKPWIQIYGFVFSIPFFIAILVLFVLLTNLSNARGKCFVTYLSFLTFGYTLFSVYKIFGQPSHRISCQIYGSVLYYTIMAALTWCCILCYDAWKTLTHMATEQPSFKKYSKIGFTIPLIMTLIKFVADYLAELPKPLNCIFLNTNPLSVLLLYDLWGILMLIYILTLYILILRYSWKTQRNQLSYFRQVRKDQVEKIMLYSRLLSVMGFEYIFLCVSRALRSFDPKNEKLVLISIYVFYSATTLQGPLMFLVFICSSRVRSGIKKKFTRNSAEVRIQLSRKNSTT